MHRDFSINTAELVCHMKSAREIKGFKTLRPIKDTAGLLHIGHG